MYANYLNNLDDYFYWKKLLNNIYNKYVTIAVKHG